MSALEGIRVICLGQFYFAPYCSMLLARMGAEVIKVEAPAGDPYRKVPTSDASGVAVQYGLVNSGKRNICVNLKTPEGVEVVKGLARTADVLVQNLAPNTMTRFGLGYEQLAVENPRLIMASGTGFGSFGPYSGRPAMDLTIQARTAIMSTTGFDDGPPVRTGPSVVDFLAGTHLAAGILGALFERGVTGLGQHVEVSLQDAVIPSLASNIAGYLSSGGTMPERTGNRNGGLAVSPYNAYQAVDGWLSLICPTDAHWERLVAAMDVPAAKDPRFATNTQRVTHMDEVDALIGAWVAPQTREQVCTALEAVNVLSAPVVTLPELLEDEHVASHAVVGKRHDDLGEWWAFGSPIFLSNTPPPAPSRPEAKGQSTDELLASVLGLSPEQISDLRQRGAIA